MSPESGAVNARPRSAVFVFDEVVSERPQGGGQTLAHIVLVSPRDGEPDVDWRRARVTVRARRGWRPNTTYTITLLPGLADLRGNVRRETGSIVFSTGPTIPDTRIAGRLFDWVAGRPAARAPVEALARPDSVVYVTRTDSSGGFELRHLPPGRYTVRGFLDPNNNRDVDLREPWDSVAVTLADTARIELLAFVHDSVGPRLSAVDVRDTITLRVTFDKPIDPRQRIDTSLFALRGADSARVPVLVARTAREFERARADSARAADTARRDTTRRADTARATPGVPGDTGARTEPPRPSRASPASEFILQVFPPLRPGGTYWLSARGMRNLLGIPADSERRFTLPPRDTTRARRDTTAARRDTGDTAPSLTTAGAGRGR